MTLSTSGGGWGARVPRPGQMDHVTWVTVRGEEPAFAHILASGIFAKDAVPDAILGAEICGTVYGIECAYRAQPAATAPSPEN